MTPERYHALMDDHQETMPCLTDEEWAAGYHFCPDWDGLLIGPGHDGELAHCHCFEPGDPRHQMVQEASARESAYWEEFARQSCGSPLDKPPHPDYTDILPSNP